MLELFESFGSAIIKVAWAVLRRLLFVVFLPLYGLYELSILLCSKKS